MKIFCIAANYRKHNTELDFKEPENPIFFIKPETSLLRPGYDFYYPEFSNQVEYETEIVIKINKMCKSVSEKFANRYFSEISLGVDFTARDIQNAARAEGLPWFLSKGFDYSAPIGEFLPKDSFKNLYDINFSLRLNGNEVQRGNTKDMIFGFEKIISHISNFCTFKMGDLIFTGTPFGVGSVKIGDVLEGFIEDKKVLEVKVK